MESISLSTLAKPLTAIGRVLMPHLKRLHAERAAGAAGGAATVALRLDLLDAELDKTLVDAELDKTLGRLENIDGHEEWWRGLLQAIQTAYIRPEFLSKPSVREWLAEAGVRWDFKAVARALLLSGSIAEDEDVAAARERLAARYADRTGEASEFAAAPIDAVVAILIAGALASLGPGNFFIAAMVQETRSDVISKIETLSAGIKEALEARPADELTTRAHTAECEQRLDRILRRRSLPMVNALAEIAELAERVGAERGDLRHCDATTRTRVLSWAARLHATSEASAQRAREFRRHLLTVHPIADTAIIDAWLDARGGDPVSGLQRLRDRDTADARSNVLSMLSTFEGSERAIAWLDAQLEAFGTDFASRTALLNGVGWRNAGAMLAEAGRWEDAARLLGAVGEEHVRQCPDLRYAEGVINAGLTLPEWLRRHALTMRILDQAVDVLEGAEPAARRDRAIALFEESAKLMRELGEDGRAAMADRWRVWLLLTDPKTREEGRRMVSAAMTEDGARAVDYVDLAFAFRVEFDPVPLERYLKLRDLSGGLLPSELAARLALIRHTRPSGEAVKFLEEQREVLHGVLTPGGYAYLLVQKLIDDGQLDRAEETLNGHREIFGDDFERMEDQIRARRGEDVLASLEKRYETTELDVDLLNLCENLRDPARDPEKLRRYALELFGRQRNVRNAHRVVEALLRLDHNAELATFLEACDDLVGMDPDLASTTGWALFHAGRPNDARPIVDRLLAQRDHPSDVALDVNVALASGQWERFPIILDREWQRRASRSPAQLLQVATIAADADRDRALKLAEEAVKRAAGDGRATILVGAHVLASRLGRDDIAMPLVAEAARLSSPEEGPVRTAGLRELADMLTAGVDRARAVEEAFAAARIPIHLFAAFVRSPLTRLLVNQLHQNEREADPRKHTVMPLRHGARGITDAAGVRTVAADFGSLLLYAELDLLTSIAARFDRIAIPFSTMELLLSETQHCRFHQPSLVAEAKRQRELVADGVFKRLDGTASPPVRLVEEVGADLAELLEAARLARGRVVRPVPIHRVDSFMEKTADLGEHAPLVLTTGQFVKLLEDEAVLDADAAERARRSIPPGEDGEPLGTDVTPSDDVPIFLDDLAVSYVSQAGLLDALRASGRQFRVHAETIERIEQLIATETEASRSLDVLFRLREWLRDGIDSDKISVMPKPPRATGDEPDEREEVPVRALRELLRDIGDCDAALIDDRMVGMHGRLTDAGNRAAPILDIFDVLHDLAVTDRAILTLQRRWRVHHILRTRGVICVPLEIEELEERIQGREPDPETGFLRETAELRAIRENLGRMRSTAILQQPAETSYLDRLRLVGVMMIRKIWGDAGIPAATAASRADWIWRHVVPAPTDWAHTIVDPVGVVPPARALAAQIGFLMLPAIPEQERRRAFLEWVEATVLAPLATASPDVLDAVAVGVGRRIQEWSEEWSAGETGDGDSDAD